MTSFDTTITHFKPFLLDRNFIRLELNVETAEAESRLAAVMVSDNR